MAIILDPLSQNKTLLDCVNETLKKVKVINSNNLLTSLTSQAKQNYIDITIQIVNEVIDQLYSDIKEPRPLVLSENTITLVAGDRDYALEDFTMLHFPLLDETNGQYIHEYPGGYMSMVNDQSFPSNYTGLPMLGAISPLNEELYLDRAPTSNEAGRIYKYRYSKDTELSVATHNVPFDDIIFRALIPAFAEKWKLENKREFNGGTYKRAIGTAARYLRKTPQNNSWVRQMGGASITDPYA
jgi:hypothetical protein